MADERERKYVQSIQKDPIERLSYEIREYMRNNARSAFMYDLSRLEEQLRHTAKQGVNLRETIKKRFGEDSLTTTRFMGPVNRTLQHVVDSVQEVLDKINLFNERRTEGIILSFEHKGKYAEANERRELYKQYSTYICDMTTALERAIIGLDRLTLEISKLRESEMERSMEVLKEIDALVDNTRLYK
jgi:hypothetical protein